MPDVLGASRRYAEATLVFGRWRDRTKTLVLCVGAVLGLIAAAASYWAVQELQFHSYDGICFAELNLLGAMVTWLAVFFAAGFVTGNIVERRTPAKLAELAAAYETPIDKLTDVAALVREL